MTDFKDRERAEEAKFALDEDTAFRVAARRNRLLGEWAAGLMRLTAEETDAYAKEVVQADFEEAGDEDVIRKVVGDLTSAGCDVDEAGVRAGRGEIAKHLADHVLVAGFLEVGLDDRLAVGLGLFGGQVHLGRCPMAEQPVATGRDAEGGVGVHRELGFLGALAIVEVGHVRFP